MRNKIFKEYDIRGIYREDFDENSAYTIGKAFGTYVKSDICVSVVVGYDNRLSSPSIKKALVEGILSSGMDVIDLGLVTTPMFYYAKKYTNNYCGIMVTASHNPKEYNGFKISFSAIGNAYGKQIQDFKKFIIAGQFDEGRGTVQNYDIKNAYIHLLTDTLDIGNRHVKALIDCGNGTASIVIKEIMEKLNIAYDLIFSESDGTFPNHHPDPSVKGNLLELSRRVREGGYTVGIAFDGDADRVGIVDEKGNILSADLVLVIFYRYLYNKMPEKRAIYDVKCSRALIDDLKAMGYQTKMYRTGNSYMNMKINKDNYRFGGEYSGHLWFNDERFPGFDDGIYAGLRMIELLSNTDKNVSGLLEGLTEYFSTDEIIMPVPEEKKFEIVEKVKEYALDKKYELVDIDGARIEFPDGWALVRASNTGPNLTLRFEGRTEERMHNIQNEVQALINSLI